MKKSDHFFATNNPAKTEKKIIMSKKPIQLIVSLESCAKAPPSFIQDEYSSGDKQPLYQNNDNFSGTRKTSKKYPVKTNRYRNCTVFWH